MNALVFRGFIDELMKIAGFASEVTSEAANLAKRVYQARKGSFAGLPTNTIKELEHYMARPQGLHSSTQLSQSAVSPAATPEFLARIRAQNAASQVARARPPVTAPQMPKPPVAKPAVATPKMAIRSAA